MATGKRVRTHPVRGSVFDLRWKADGKLSAVTFFGHDVFLMQEFAAELKPDANEEAKEYLNGLPALDPAQYELRKLHHAIQKDVDILTGIWHVIKDILA